ncbi:uncharacterized protein [Hetaerina americana]|uniref:uncharacterized protein n=1 Tax=Hetaerina americana TaxID=62018 RepID=UPI003A7F3AC2
MSGRVNPQINIISQMRSQNVTHHVAALRLASHITQNGRLPSAVSNPVPLRINPYVSHSCNTGNIAVHNLEVNMQHCRTPGSVQIRENQSSNTAGGGKFGHGNGESMTENHGNHFAKDSQGVPNMPPDYAFCKPMEGSETEVKPCLSYGPPYYNSSAQPGNTALHVNGNVGNSASKAKSEDEDDEDDDEDGDVRPMMPSRQENATLPSRQQEMSTMPHSVKVEKGELNCRSGFDPYSSQDSDSGSSVMHNLASQQESTLPNLPVAQNIYPGREYEQGHMVYRDYDSQQRTPSGTLFEGRPPSYDVIGRCGNGQQHPTPQQSQQQPPGAGQYEGPYDRPGFEGSGMDATRTPASLYPGYQGTVYPGAGEGAPGSVEGPGGGDGPGSGEGGGMGQPEMAPTQPIYPRWV